MLNKTLPYIDILMKKEPPHHVSQVILDTERFTTATFRDGDERAWAAIETSVGEFSDETAALNYFTKNYLPEKEQLKTRCFFIVERATQRKIATGTAWYQMTDQGTIPKVDWISVHPNYQGLDLGKAIIQIVLQKFAQIASKETIYLHTQTWSHQAVALYQKVGFTIMNEPNIWNKYPNNLIEYATEIVTLANAQKLLLSEQQHSFAFSPCELQGEVTIPPSKSYLHRYLIAAAITQQPIEFLHVSTIATDVQVTLDALKHLALGSTYDAKKQILHVYPLKQEQQQTVKINMKESGSSLRLLLPLLAYTFQNVEITGENRLPMRPLEPYMNVFDSLTFTKTTSDNLPLTITGSITAKTYHFTSQMSSQFISGLLFTLPLLPKKSTIRLDFPPRSLPYIQMTLDVLQHFKIKVTHNDNYTFFEIAGMQQYIAPTKRQIVIESDYSARAFWDIAHTLKHQKLKIKPTAQPSLQGDAQLLEIIAQKKQDIDLTPIPDLAPILAVYLSQTHGGTLRNVDVLIHKESNRLLAIKYFLIQAGITFEHTGNALKINVGTMQSNTYFTFYDHRITMALIIAASMANGTFTLNEVASVAKSYPNFLTDYQSLGGSIHEQ